METGIIANDIPLGVPLDSIKANREKAMVLLTKIKQERSKHKYRILQFDEKTWKEVRVKEGVRSKE